MKKLFFAFTIGICVPVFAGVLFVYMGGMPVATKGPPLPFERFLARTAIHAAIGDQEDKPSPVTADEIAFQSGAKVYMNHCAVCHGTFGGHPTKIAQGLFPKPPQLLDADDQITDDPVGEAYWKVKNGIRLTGMPGFVDSLSDTEIWQVSLLLVNADKLSEAVKQVLTLASPQ
jgi:thiosulfate dehydrogenase